MDKSSLEALIKWLEIWSAIFGVGVVVGVAGESYFGIRLLWNSWKLQRIQTVESEQLRAGIAQANVRAAEANEKAEREHLELIRIEQRFAPRRLTAEEKTRITTKLSAFPARRVEIVEAKDDDPEVKGFVIDIFSAFNDAHWESRVITDPQHVSRVLTGML